MTSKNVPQPPSEHTDFFRDLSDSKTIEPKNAKPKNGLDEEIAAIYTQAKNHREKLITFYIWYTIVLSAFIMAIILLQANARLSEGNQQIELIPQWALSILVAGMFGQFIGLLTIVTKKVWTFEPFLKHHQNSNNKENQ